jgi:hypothetical protein
MRHDTGGRGDDRTRQPGPRTIAPQQFGQGIAHGIDLSEALVDRPIQRREVDRQRFGENALEPLRGAGGSIPMMVQVTPAELDTRHSDPTGVFALPAVALSGQRHTAPIEAADLSASLVWRTGQDTAWVGTTGQGTDLVGRAGRGNILADDDGRVAARCMGIAGRSIRRIGVVDLARTGTLITVDPRKARARRGGRTGSVGRTRALTDTTALSPIFLTGTAGLESACLMSIEG